LPVKLVPLDSSWEPFFWDHVLQDVPEHYFFIFDWKLNKDKTRIFLALQNEEIVGLLLLYDQRIVQIRGRPEAAELLMRKVDLEKAEINVLKEHESAVLKKYKSVTKHEMILMTLKRGKEHLHIKHPVTKLTPMDAPEIASLLNEGFPEFGEFTPDGVIERIKDNVLFLGVKESGKLVALGNTRILDIGSNIGMVDTREGHRGKGYATSIVSALLKEILRESRLALIHVLSDNPSAIHVYTKVGFKPYKAYSFIRGERVT